jgi:transcriptional regulator with XRE-family HTH domain
LKAGLAVVNLYWLRARDEIFLKHSRSTFVFTPELGAKLRAIRRKRNLTLRGLAVLMGRVSPGAFNHLAKLERGDLKHPSVNLLLDYLRACGGGPQDVAALFDSYLSLPPVPRTKSDAVVAKLLEVLPEPEQRAVLAWDKGITKAREERAAAEPGRKQPRVETAQQRVFRIVWSFVHANWNEVFEQKLYETMLKLKDDVPRSERRLACELARRFFSILTRYYANAARRQGALDRIERRAAESGFSKETIAALLEAATQSYIKLLLSDRLDWEPTQLEIISRRGLAPKVLKAEARLDMEEAKPVSEQNRAYGLIRAIVLMAVNAKLDEQKLDFYYVKRHYHNWVDRLLQIALAHGVGSPEWQAEVDATAPRLHDETFARAMATLAAETFDKWKVRLSPKPPNAT